MFVSQKPKEGLNFGWNLLYAFKADTRLILKFSYAVVYVEEVQLHRYAAFLCFCTKRDLKKRIMPARPWFSPKHDPSDS